MNPQLRLYIGLIVVTAALFGGLLYVGSREGSKTSDAPTGAAASTAFAEEANVLYFYSDACHFCQLQKPILNELAQEGYRVRPMDVVGNPRFWTQYNIEGTPTFIAENGDRLVGLQEKDDLRQFLDAHGGKTVPSG
jgi:thiol-disulfide isomerase/thioredoxin